MPILHTRSLAPNIKLALALARLHSCVCSMAERERTAITWPAPVPFERSRAGCAWTMRVGGAFLKSWIARVFILRRNTRAMVVRLSPLVGGEELWVEIATCSEEILGEVLGSINWTGRCEDIQSRLPWNLLVNNAPDSWIIAVTSSNARFSGRRRKLPRELFFSRYSVSVLCMRCAMIF